MNVFQKLTQEQKQHLLFKALRTYSILKRMPNEEHQSTPKVQALELKAYSDTINDLLPKN